MYNGHGLRIAGNLDHRLKTTVSCKTNKMTFSLSQISEFLNHGRYETLSFDFLCCT